jgi:hypothetical protein
VFITRAVIAADTATIAAAITIPPAITAAGMVEEVAGEIEITV